MTALGFFVRKLGAREGPEPPRRGVHRSTRRGQLRPFAAGPVDMALIDGEAVLLKDDGRNRLRPPSGAETEAGGFECNHPSRLAQFDAQLMIDAHDHDVPSTAGPRLQEGEMASIESTTALHTITRSCSLRCPMSIDRASSTPVRPVVEFWLRRRLGQSASICRRHGGSALPLALILYSQRS
jgi:hypothetical protein